MMQRNWELLFPKTTLCIIYSDAVSVLFFYLNGISLMFVWILIAKEREKTIELFVLFYCHFALICLTETNLTAMLATTKFLGYKNRSRMQERLSQTGLLTLEFLFQSKSRQKWVSMVGNYKKVHLKSKKIKKLSRIAWVYYQEKKYKTNHKF